MTAPVATEAVADSGGKLEVEYTFRAVIGVGARQEVDCLNVECQLVALDGADKIVASAPILWSGSARAAPSPTLAISQVRLDQSENKGLALVSGSGYPPDTALSLVQCPDDPTVETAGVDANDCLYRFSRRVKTDGAGSFNIRLPVYPRFQKFSGDLINCSASPEACVIADPWPKKGAYRMSQVSFADAS